MYIHKQTYVSMRVCLPPVFEEAVACIPRCKRSVSTCVQIHTCMHTYISIQIRQVPPGQSWGTFHIAVHTAGPNSDTRCYGLFWETAGIWTDLRDGNPPFAYPLWDELNKSYTKKFQISDTAWRHIAWVFDENDDTVTYYLDGQFLQKRKWGKSVKQMDCAPANVTVGHRYPGNTYAWDVSIQTAPSLLVNDSCVCLHVCIRKICTCVCIRRSAHGSIRMRIYAT